MFVGAGCCNVCRLCCCWICVALRLKTDRMIADVKLSPPLFINWADEKVLSTETWVGLVSLQHSIVRFPAVLTSSLPHWSLPALKHKKMCVDVDNMCMLEMYENSMTQANMESNLYLKPLCDQVDVIGWLWIITRYKGLWKPEQVKAVTLIANKHIKVWICTNILVQLWKTWIDNTNNEDENLLSCKMNTVH